MRGRGDPWGWAGDVSTFITRPVAEIQFHLEMHHVDRLAPLALGELQRGAWDVAIRVLQESLHHALGRQPNLRGSLIALEYELPGEAGRRPDCVIVLPTGHLVVVEIKNKARPERADIDQCREYALDLLDYHSMSHALRAHPVLAVLGNTRAEPPMTHFDVLIDFNDGGRLLALEDLLADFATLEHMKITPADWLEGEYAPLPALIDAAVSTFRGHPLPEIKSVQSTSIPEVLDWLRDLGETAERNKQHALVLITGAPGTGKTLVGVQAVVDQAARGARAVYLSGNGPLVGVLQHAIDELHDAKPARALIRGMIEFKRTVVRPKASRFADFYVFDEGQRAWTEVKDYEGNEIELLIDVASRSEWGVVVGLIGEGQAIWKNEEGSQADWLKAVGPARTRGKRWIVYHPGELTPPMTPSVEFVAKPILRLDKSLRSKRVTNLHQWVNLVLDDAADTGVACELATEIRGSGFPIYLAASRSDAQSYVVSRYHATSKKYGWVASSQDTKNVHGIDLLKTKWASENKTVYGPWFNAPADDPRSCRSLTNACKEFGCQGLELDFVLLAWGRDLRHNGSSWEVGPRTRRSSDKPREHAFNAYRVLLTRAREGMIILCSDDGTRARLTACGAILLASPSPTPSPH